MKLFIVSVLLAVASAKPSGIASPVAYSIASPLALSPSVFTQFHSQDELGQYNYAYSNALSAKAEARTANGVTVGGYTYVDPEGKLQAVEYSSDVNGFRVAASNLPVPPAIPVAPALPVPVPVQDTPEVAEAKAKHLEALEAAKQVNSLKFAGPLATVVQTVNPIVGSSPLVATPLVAAAPIAAPLLAARSGAEISTESTQPTAPPSSEAPTTPAPLEEASTPAPEEASTPAQSALLPSAGPGATPAGVSILPAPGPVFRTIVAPALPAGVAIVPGPAAYSISSLYPSSFSSYVVQPSLTTYTAQYLAPGQIVQNHEISSPAKSTEQSSE